MKVKVKAARTAAAALTAFGVFFVAAEPVQANPIAPIVTGLAAEVIALDAPTALAAASAGLITLSVAEVLAAAAVPVAVGWCFFNCADAIATIRARVQDFTAGTPAEGTYTPTAASPYGIVQGTAEVAAALGISNAPNGYGNQLYRTPSPYSQIYPGSITNVQFQDLFLWSTNPISGGTTSYGYQCWNGTAVTSGTHTGTLLNAGDSTHWGLAGAECTGAGQQIVKYCIESCVAGQPTWTYKGSDFINATTPATARITVTCKAPGGATTTYTVNGSATNQDVNLTVPPCPSGTYRKAIDTYKGTQGGTLTHTGHAAVPDSVESSYPGCFLSSTTPCQMRVTVGGTVITDASDIAGSTIQDALATGTYGCSFTNGSVSYSATLSACAPIVDAYRTPGYSPSSPSPSPSPSGTPTPTPTPTPSNDPTASPPAAPTDPSQCAPSGWGYLNPMTLVGSMGCLLQYLFVPSSAALQASLTGVQTAWDASAVGAFTEAMVAVPASLSGLGAAGSGTSHCEGPLVTLPEPLNISFHLLGACTAPASQLAFGARSIAALFIIVNGSALVYRPVQQALNLPGLPWGRKDGDL